jgi:hypothetical protein
LQREVEGLEEDRDRVAKELEEVSGERARLQGEMMELMNQSNI